MTTNSWFFFALGAAILWGVGYVIAEKLLRMGMTPAFIIFFDALVVMPFYFIIALKFGEIQENFRIMWENNVVWLAVLSGLTVMGGNFFIIMSVAEKNATMASLIEISYPIFTFLFAWLILKEVQLTMEMALGGALIFSGITLIFVKS